MKKRIRGRVRFAVAVTFMIATAACVSGVVDAAWPMALQAGPLWVRVSVEATAVGFALIALMLVGTFIFGRFFCSILCPLGALQDIVDLLGHKGRKIPNPRTIRYMSIAVSLAFLAGGTAVIFRLFDPFSRFATISALVERVVNGYEFSPTPSGLLWGGSVIIVSLILLVLWKRRLFCVSLCPVGAVLGVIGKFGVYRMQITESCVTCGRCESACPTGCIDVAGRSVDAERCVLCLQCSSVCPNGSVTYGRSLPRDEPREIAGFSESKRRFLIIGSAMTVGAIGVGTGLRLILRGLAQAAENVRMLILPPGGY